jgi:hypothetical protein
MRSERESFRRNVGHDCISVELSMCLKKAEKFSGKSVGV